MKMNLLLLTLVVSMPLVVNAKKLTPSEFNDCLYLYWEPRYRSDLISAEAALGLARTALRPDVSAGITRTGDIFSSSTKPYNFASVTIKQTLVNFATWASISANELALKAAGHSIEDQLLTLSENSTHSLYSLLQSRAALQLQKKRLPRIDQLISLSKELTRLKLSDYSSVLSAQTSKLSLEAAIKTTQAQVFTQTYGLMSLIGNAGTDIDFDDSYDPKVNDSWTFWEKKIEDLPIISSLKATIGSLSKTAEADKLQSAPVLKIGTTAFQYPIEQAPPDGRTAVVQLSLTIPLYDQGLSSVAVQKDLEQKRFKEAVLMSTREQIRNNLRVLLNQIDTDEQILLISKELRDKAQQTYTAMAALFEFGKTSFLNVSAAETNLNSAENQLISIQLQLAGEKTQLEQYGNYSEGKLLQNRNKCPISLKSK